MTKFVAKTYNHAIMRYDEIEKKPYHFTLERIDPDNENVPEAVIPEYMMKTGGPCLIISTAAHPLT